MKAVRTLVSSEHEAKNPKLTMTLATAAMKRQQGGMLLIGLDRIDMSPPPHTHTTRCKGYLGTSSLVKAPLS